ncbi:putative efflux pump membrane transporter TtgB [Pirellula sp. SH-Sr6A]|uniref:efflux RND transporter permease subunit n=1 Tax=Pirellula sp. SH-Sr6A TaxID=1632865 RepID=UPI00078C0173|nr:efflux RND transporter permease subunit [Pirellula sp. SH-Sr6A]AMV33348.1 putative efflux pump membrane transporter TtgB [Pirellula sp. SH-Sr6A]
MNTTDESKRPGIFNLSHWAVTHPAFISFLMLAFGAAGLQAYLSMGRAEDPSFTIKTGVVTASWPGATSKEMQEQVAEEVEDKLRETPYLDFLQTYCLPDRMQTLVQLKDHTPPKQVADIWYQVRKKLGDIESRMPQGVVGPYVNDEYGDVYSAIYAFYGDDFSYAELKRVAESTRKRLLRVADVEKVDLVGDQDERIYIEFSHQKLATLGVSPQAIFDSIQKQNALVRSGSIDTSNDRIHVRVARDFDGVSQIQEVPVQGNGRVFRLKDIAEVKRGYEDPSLFKLRFNSHPAVALGVVMTKGGNVLSLGKQLEAAMEEITSQLPVGMNMGNIAFQPHVVEESVGEFTQSFVEALVIVLIVSFLSLGLRTGIVVALSVPLVLAVSLMIMNAIGMNLDRISLGALILALGLLVDDAIIAVEMMAVKMEEGWNRVDAAGFAWRSTAFPMLSGTLITMAGFLPVGFARSAAGEYAGGIFWVVGITLIISWFVAVIFTPHLGVQLLPDLKKGDGHGEHVPFQTPFHRALRWLIRGCVKRPYAVVSITVMMFIAALFGFTRLQQQFFPLSSRTELMVDVRLHEGSSIQATEEMIQSVEQRIRPFLNADGEHEPLIQHFTSYVGAGSARFFLALNPDLPNPSFGKIVIQTTSVYAREELRTRLKKLFEQDGQFADASVRVLRLEFGPPTGYPVQFRVIGPDPSTVRRIAKDVRQVMRSDPAAIDVNLEWDEPSKSVQVDIDQDRVRLMGLTPQEVELGLETLLSGTTVSQFRDGTETIPVVARAIESERASVEKLGNLTLFTPNGKVVPIEQVGKIRPSFEEPIVWRRNQERMLSVRCDVADGFQAPDITNRMEKELAELKSSLPPGYRIEAGGAAEESVKANKALFAMFPPMILIMLTLLMSQVHSFKKMILIFGIAPLGLIGAVASLHVFNAPFGFVALLGVIALAGMDMRNSVILVDQIEQDIASGLNEWDAVIESSVRRARPVILTAATAILAMIPLTRSVFWGPMAMAIMGGLSIATFLTLVNLPALYVLFFRVKPSVSTEASTTRSEKVHPHVQKEQDSGTDSPHPTPAFG